ncbi:hypothetical protein [Chromohalobacter sp. 296-RDG]|uniref:hypothetical protein n=1 Tax=Chromohalobacter sp. 296-RDG TaxID=2994062 RepID=UPI002469A99C|nr:hypothetical protein [Chromohalobacter sp. 296-RDG]
MNSQQSRGGAVARQAAMLCQDAAFRLYLDRRRRHKFGIAARDLPDGTHNEQDARDWLCQACGIQSRAELDTKAESEHAFHHICNRFNRWKAKNRGSR